MSLDQKYLEEIFLILPTFFSVKNREKKRERRESVIDISINLTENVPICLGSYQNNTLKISHS